VKKIIPAIVLLLFLCGCSLPWQDTASPTGEAPPMEPETVFREMYRLTGAIVLELHFSDGSSYGPYTCHTLPDGLKLTDITEITHPDISASTQWLTVRSPDEARKLTVYQGKPEIICWQQDGLTRYYAAKDGTQQTLRKVFDLAARRAYGRISFFSGKSGKAILDAYGETALPDFLYRLPPGDPYQIKDYQCRKVKLEDKNGRILCGTITYAVKHTLRENAGLPFFGEAVGEEASWNIYKKTFYVERQSDGKWHELAPADYHKVYTEEHSPYVPPAEPAETAVEFLKALPERVEQLREIRKPEDIIALAETFLQTTSAVPLAGKTDFDWTVFCEESAMRNAGIQAFFLKYVTTEGARGYFNGFLQGTLRADTVILEKDTAMLANDRIRLWFTKTAGVWKVTDASIAADL